MSTQDPAWMAWANPRTAWKKYLLIMTKTVAVVVTLGVIAYAASLWPRLFVEAVLLGTTVYCLIRERTARADCHTYLQVAQEAAERYDEVELRRKRIELSSFMFIVASQWDASKRKKTHKTSGGTVLDQKYYLERFGETVKERWPNHELAPDQILSLAESLVDRNDPTRWALISVAEQPPVT